MLIIESVRDRNKHLVSSLVPRFVAANQENSGTQWIERIQDPKWASCMLNPEFAHMPVPRSRHARRIRERQRNAVLSKQLDAITHAVLLFRREACAPVTEFIGELDLCTQNQL